MIQTRILGFDIRFWSSDANFWTVFLTFRSRFRKLLCFLCFSIGVLRDYVLCLMIAEPHIMDPISVIAKNSELTVIMCLVSLASVERLSNPSCEGSCTFLPALGVLPAHLVLLNPQASVGSTSGRGLRKPHKPALLDTNSRWT
jgi:hypothetical protein